MTERSEHIANIVRNLPEGPGVYQYYDQNGVIIYVGKAKNLKRRVSSYFNKTSQTSKVRALVAKIHDLKYIVVNTEADALLLENNLIKKHQPHYNILLKDSKTYPWLCVTKEPLPRVFKTRQTPRGAELYGPYCSVWVLDTLLELIREIYPVRTCNGYMDPLKIQQGKYRRCLKYHIHKCMAPCESLQSVEDYQRMISEIRAIAKGDSHRITDYLLERMRELSEAYRFEEAAELKKKYDAIVHYQSRTVITTTHSESLDVFGYDEDESAAYVNMLHIHNGSIVQAYTIEYQKRLDEPREELLASGILELRTRFKSAVKEILVPFLPDITFDGTEISVPQKGDKKKLLDLSAQNVKQYRIDKYRQNEKTNAAQRSVKLLTEIKDRLLLPKTPFCIDSFDNSNLSGSDAVSVCVVYRNGKPSKSDYRKYNIQTVSGPDDYASMREVARRRYGRMKEEGAPLPDLIVADGGLGQMEALRGIVEDELHLNIAIIGLAKNDKHKTNEVLTGFPPSVVQLKVNDPVFRFFAGIQEEVHRFAIQFHRDKRSKSQLHSELDDIKGIGPRTRNLLLKELKSVKRIRNAEFSVLEKIIGTSRASIIYKYFSENKANEN